MSGGAGLKTVAAAVEPVSAQSTAADRPPAKARHHPMPSQPLTHTSERCPLEWAGPISLSLYQASQGLGSAPAGRGCPQVSTWRPWGFPCSRPRRTWWPFESAAGQGFVAKVNCDFWLTAGVLKRRPKMRQVCPVDIPLLQGVQRSCSFGPRVQGGHDLRPQFVHV